MSRVQSQDGTAIAYERTGEGPPLVLVDGALCSRAFGPMPKLAPLLAHAFTVFTYDRRGRNESGDSAPYAVEREVEDLAAIVAAAGGSAGVLGLSSGAALALEAAASGVAIDRLLLYEPPYVDRDGRHAAADHAGELRRRLDAGRRGDAVFYFMTTMVGMPRPFAALFRLLPMWSKLKAVAHTLPYDATVMGSFTVPERRAAAVRVPTLAVGGEKSPEPLRHAVRSVAAAVPGAVARFLVGQNHNVSLPALAPVAQEFFAR